MKQLTIHVLLIFLFFSCSSGNKEQSATEDNPIDSFESALPHGKMLKERELSDEDKIKLAKATGRKAEVLTFDALKALIEEDSSGLVIYNFWDLDCQNCVSSIEMLRKIQYEVFDSLYVKVVYINTNGLFPDMVNSYIREKEIVDQVYTVAMDSIPNWSSYFQNGWEGQLPATLIVNNEDGIRLFYQKEFTIEEFQTVLLPLTF